MKRVREGEPDPGEHQGVQSSATTHPPNEFGQWLLENIYKYAEVRDSEELAKLRKELRRVDENRRALVQFAWEVVHDNDYQLYQNFCSACGNTRLKESRTICGRCNNEYVPCSQCVPRFCASKRHLLCNACIEDEEEDDDDVVCNGVYPYDCAFEQ